MVAGCTCKKCRREKFEIALFFTIVLLMTGVIAINVMIGVVYWFKLWMSQV